MNFELSSGQIISALAVMFSTSLGGVLAFIGFLLKDKYLTAKKRAEDTNNFIKNLQESFSKNIEDLDKSIAELQGQIQGNYSTLKEFINDQDKKRTSENAELRAEVKILASQTQDYTSKVSSLTGRMDDQSKQTGEFISSISHMSKQVTRLFDIADAVFVSPGRVNLNKIKNKEEGM